MFAIVVTNYRYLALFKVHYINPENVRARDDL